MPARENGHGLCVIEVVTLPEKRGSLRVATLNLWGRFADWPRRRGLLSAQLPALDVDVYFLQEVVCGENAATSSPSSPSSSGTTGACA